MNNDYRDELNRYYKVLADKQPSPETLTSLYKFILKNYDEGLIEDKDLAYDIAGTLQFDLENYPKLREITDLAAELELPDAQISGDPKAKLERLLSLLRQL